MGKEPGTKNKAKDDDQKLKLDLALFAFIFESVFPFWGHKTSGSDLWLSPL